MRNDSLMNGGLIGFGLGFILASIALQRVVRLVIPEYATLWHFRGVIIIGLLALGLRSCRESGRKEGRRVRNRVM